MQCITDEKKSSGKNVVFMFLEYHMTAILSAFLYEENIRILRLPGKHGSGRA
jgi:hypothetical protein